MILRVPWWLSGLRICHCHCCGLSGCCGTRWIPGPRTLACHRLGKKKKKDSQLPVERELLHSFLGFLGLSLPEAYGSFQARSQIRATAAGLRHSILGSQLCLRPTPQITARPDPRPLSEARDQTRILVDTSWIHFHCTTTGTPPEFFFKLETSPFIFIHFSCSMLHFLFFLLFFLLSFRAALAAYGGSQARG